LDAFKTKFKDHWGEYKYSYFLLVYLTSLHKWENKIVIEFNQHFMKALKKLPTLVRHSEPIAFVMYTSMFGVDFNC
jgi:hypothetical protein